MANLTSELFPSKYPRKIYSVSQVNKIAKDTLENFSGWVRGEIVELKKFKTKFNNDYFRFRLKDEDNQHTLPVVAWQEAAMNLEFELKNGLEIIIFGNLTLYEKTGDYQFQAQVIELYGNGVLAIKLEQLKRKLASEGVFDVQRKKIFPKFPTNIGLITRFESDAWFDFKKNALDKFGFFKVYLADIFVQGENAATDIIWAIDRLNQEAVEVIVLTRGGGSLDELSKPFNTEEVVRKVASCPVPVISAIGHETYETLTDLAAKVRVSTPTAAARLITANFEEFLTKSAQYELTLKSLARNYYKNKLLEIANLGTRLQNGIKSFIIQKENLLAQFESSLKKIPVKLIDENWKKMASLTHELALLSPQKILERGYSITYRLPTEEILRSSNKIKSSEKVRVKLAKGEIKAKVFEVKE